MQVPEMMSRMILMPINTMVYGTEMLSQSVKSVKKMAENTLGVEDQEECCGDAEASEA